MDLELLAPITVTLAGAVVVLLSTSIGFGIAWIRARDRARRAERDLAARERCGSPTLERLEHAVDAIAVEVERISESERFQSQLLARGERPPERLASPAKVITPH